MPNGADKVSKYNNYVHNDAIWRQNIMNEMHFAKRWDPDYGFMKGGVDGQVEQMHAAEAARDAESDSNGRERLKLPPIHHRQSTYRNLDTTAAIVPAAPRTTASEVGWVSGVPKNNLERYGGYAKGRRNVERFLGWTGLAI